MSGLNLNGSTALAESIKQQLKNVRRDWEVAFTGTRLQISEAMRELERTMSAARELLARVQDGAPGRDGKDGQDGAPGRDGVDGKPGRDGQDGAPGQPGQPGTPGERGEPGPKGVFAAPLPFKAGQITYGGALVYHEGSTFCALKDTAATPPHADFQPVAYKGRDGRDAYTGRALGLYDPKRTDYRAMDVVTLNGSEWRAVKDNPGALPGDDWVLGAKGVKGKPGEAGPRGEPGERGPIGPPGLGLAEVELQGELLVFTRTDGSILHVDLGALIG